ncbi:MAG: helix-turn-helix transcriptional regulator [Saprospiraceae bacterium]|nr:helix-turn-helix transcriptional regulator [Saprospiraceae bacterium]
MKNFRIKSNLYLSVRELEISKLVVSGKSSKQIASILNLSVHTVNTHRRNIINRVGAKNLAEVLYKLVKIGLI